MKELQKLNFNKYLSEYQYKLITYIKKCLSHRIFDADKNGTISKAELLKIVHHLFHLIPEKHKENLPTPQKVKQLLVDSMLIQLVVVCLSLVRD